MMEDKKNHTIEIVVFEKKLFVLRWNSLSRLDYVLTFIQLTKNLFDANPILFRSSFLSYSVC